MSIHLLDKPVVRNKSVSATRDILAALRAAAAAGDERAFLLAEAQISWQRRPAADFLQAIQFALSAGAHRSARKLAAQSAIRYPKHTELQKYARVLAPPRVTVSPLPPDPGLKANRDWLMDHGDEYRGQWVALRSGQLLAVAASLKELTEEIDESDGMLLTRVF